MVFRCQGFKAHVLSMCVDCGLFLLESKVMVLWIDICLARVAHIFPDKELFTLGKFQIHHGSP